MEAEVLEINIELLTNYYTRQNSLRDALSAHPRVAGPLGPLSVLHLGGVEELIHQLVPVAWADSGKHGGIAC